MRVGRRGGLLTNQRPLERDNQPVEGEFVGDDIVGDFRTHVVGPARMLVIPTRTPHDHRPTEGGKSALLVVKVPARRRGRPA